MGNLPLCTQSYFDSNDSINQHCYSISSKPVQFMERMRPGASQMICAAWSPGGTFLASGSADHHVRVYMMAESGPKRILEVSIQYKKRNDHLIYYFFNPRIISLIFIIHILDRRAFRSCGFVAMGTFRSTIHFRIERRQRNNVATSRYAMETYQIKHVRYSSRVNQSHIDIFISFIFKFFDCSEQPNSEDVKKLKVTMVAWDCVDNYVITAVSDHSLKVYFRFEFSGLIVFAINCNFTT
jgi:bromodomain and WD repeat domain containing protein 1/3